MSSTANVPLLSVGYPVYNGEKYMRESIDCILGQTFKDFELIISDNKSTDSTQQICEEYAQKDSRVRYVRQEENIGAPGNFNAVFELSRGEYFKWASYDDLIYPTFLEKCLNGLRERESEGYVACYPETENLSAEGVVTGVFHEPDMRITSDDPVHRFRDLTYEIHSCLIIFGVIRSDVLRRTCQMGQWLASDYTLAGQLGLLGKVHLFPEKLFQWRSHEEASLESCGSDYYRYAVSWVPVEKKKKILLPYWKMAVESGRGVMRLCTSWGQRFRCLWSVVTCRQRARGRSQYLWDIVHAVKLFFRRLLKSERA